MIPNCRRVHLGDIDDGSEAIPRGEEQRGYWQVGERRASGSTPQLSSPPLQSDVRMLGIRAQQEANLPTTQTSIVRNKGRREGSITRSKN